jgi:hypothetical protein
MNNKIRLNKIKIRDNSYPTRIISKGSDNSVNSLNLTNQVTIDIAESTNLCIPPDHDCNYFLGKGIIPTDVENCDVGIVKSRNVNNPANTIQFEGKVSYLVNNKTITRKQMTAYLTQIEQIINYVP